MPQIVSAVLSWLLPPRVCQECLGPLHEFDRRSPAEPMAPALGRRSVARAERKTHASTIEPRGVLWIERDNPGKSPSEVKKLRSQELSGNDDRPYSTDDSIILVFRNQDNSIKSFELVVELRRNFSIYYEIIHKKTLFLDKEYDFILAFYKKSPKNIIIDADQVLEWRTSNAIRVHLYYRDNNKIMPSALDMDELELATVL